MESFWLLLRFVAASALVGALAYGATRLLRRRWRSVARTRHLDMLESVPVGTRQHLVLVRLGRKRVLCLGVTPEAIRRLDVLEGDEAGEALGGGGRVD